MPKIIILRGNSGSGKSITAKALQRKIGRGTFIISQDYVRREMLWVKDSLDNRAVDLLKALVLYGHENCEVTILEGILSSDKYESLFKTVKAAFGDQIFAYYFDLPFEETLSRHMKKQDVEFGEPEMKKWWREKDYLTNISEKIIGQEMGLDEVVELIYRDISW